MVSIGICKFFISLLALDDLTLSGNSHSCLPVQKATVGNQDVEKDENSLRRILYAIHTFPRHPFAVLLQLQCYVLALSKPYSLPQVWAKPLPKNPTHHPDEKVHRGELFLQPNPSFVVVYGLKFSSPVILCSLWPWTSISLPALLQVRSQAGSFSLTHLCFLDWHCHSPMLTLSHKYSYGHFCLCLVD